MTEIVQQQYLIVNLSDFPVPFIQSEFIRQQSFEVYAVVLHVNNILTTDMSPIEASSERTINRNALKFFDFLSFSRL